MKQKLSVKSISNLGIVKMNHCTIVLDHVDFLNAGDVVDWEEKIKLGIYKDSIPTIMVNLRKILSV